MPTSYEEQQSESPLREYLRVVRRRKWIVLLPILLAPLAAVLLSLQQQKLYWSSSEVLLSHRDLGAVLTGTPEVYEDPNRIAQTQAQLARSPRLAERVLQRARIEGRNQWELVAALTVTPRSDADLLEFGVKDPDPNLAPRLATAYANEFIEYRRELDTAAIVRARRKAERQVDELEAAGDRNSRLYTDLVSKLQQLQTMEAFQTSNALLSRPAEGAAQVEPKTSRNAILALALGVMLSFGLTLLFKALDTGLEPEEIGRRLRLPLLGRLAAPPRRLRKQSKLAMLSEPNGSQAEAFRMLRTNLDFVNLEHGAQAIMVTSAVASEGKSTTVANLAVAIARAGRRVVLVDSDLRRPFLHHFFEVPARPGLTDVALGRVTLEQAIKPLVLSDSPDDEFALPGGADLAFGNGMGGNGSAAVLEVLLAGPTPPDVSAFFESSTFEAILAELRERADLVLFDSPPLLQAGDAMALSGKVDALVVVTRGDQARRPITDELERLLARSPAQKLGFVLTGLREFEEGYNYRTYEATRGAKRAERVG